MKRILTIISLAGACLPAYSQKNIGTEPLPAKEFYNTKEWDKAFAGYYGVNPGTEPGVPDDEAERTVLGAIRTLIAAGTDQSIEEAASQIDTLVSTQQGEGKKTSPMMLQIAGTLNMRLADNADAPAEKERYVKRAQTYLQRAIDPETGFPNFLRAHKNLANLLFRSDKSKEAKEHFIKAIELGDRDAVTFGLLGAIYMDEGKLISSESALRNSLMINPNIIEFKQLLGNVLLQQERYNEAKEIFTELLVKRPNEVNFWTAQANSFIALEMIDEATKNLEIVRFMGKANSPSLMLLGDVYMNKEMIDEATEAYLEAISLDQSNSNLDRYIGAAETLKNFAANDQSMTVVNKIIDTFGEEALSDEEMINLLSLKSEINIALGHGEEAAENLENLLRKDPMNGRALLSLASYYTDVDPDSSLSSEDQDLQKQRNQQRALIYFDRAQNLDNPPVQARAFIGEAQLRVERDELEEAADLLQEAQYISYQENVQTYLEQIRAALRSRRRG